MSNIPAELKYTKEHEWAKLEGDILSVGITDFAQSSLGDIVFVELPEVGTDIDKEGAFGVVESIKSVSDLYSPVAGKVIEVNSDLESSPEQCNEDAYGSWMMKIKVNNIAEVEEMLTADQYKEICENEH